MMRAMTSVGPAGENGTITLTACVGYSLDDCAAAFCARLELASTRAAQKRSRRTVVFIGPSLDFSAMLPLPAPLGSRQTSGCDERARRTPGVAYSLPSGLRRPERRASLP